MLQLFNSITARLFGDPRRFALEHRLFNTISLLNAVANVGGAFAVLSQRNYAFLFALNLGTGILFLAFYYLSRFRNANRFLYWPFVLLILSFLFVNALGNAGSRGGAHYYFIPALVISVILSGRTRRTVIAIILFCAATAALQLLEQMRPGWFSMYANDRERFIDISTRSEENRIACCAVCCRRRSLTSSNKRIACSRSITSTRQCSSQTL